LNLTDEENAKICCADGSNLYAASINNAMVGVYCDKLTPIYWKYIIIEKILPNATISIIYLGIVEKIICLAVKFKKFFCAEEKVFL